jgi:hypothetical protein
VHRLAIGAVCALLGLVPRTVTAQGASSSTPPVPLVRVFLICDGCDTALKAAAAFVEYVTDREQATVEVVVTAPGPETPAGWRLAFTGRGTFAGQDRRLSYEAPAGASAEAVRAGLARVFRFGLVDYAMRSDSAAHLDVTFSVPEALGEGQAPTASTPAHDPWNYWVFRVGASGDRYGERTQSSSYYSGSVSANRTTEAWKIRLSAYRSGNSSRFMVDEETTIRTNEGDWSVDSLVVKSLGPHWSAGFTSALTSSTYSNQQRTANFNPAIEYDIFPYAESSQRSLTIQYAVGVSRYEYAQITIYDKLDETMPKHNLTVALGLRQPWGTAGASSTFSQSLNEPKFNRLSINGSTNVRIFKGFTVNGSGSFSRIRDQFYLEKIDATPEEVLLRLRQLATGHRYSVSFGITYSFGSLSNATVNPRFGG